MPLARLLERYLDAEDWDEAREILGDHSELLSDEALALLGAMAARSDHDPERAASLGGEIDFLSSCRALGIDAAFRERLIASCETEIQELRFEDDRDNWIGFRLSLATAWAERTIGDISENQEKARSIYEEVLARASLDEAPGGWLGARTGLIRVYRRRATGRPEENLEAVIALEEEILRSLPAGSWPETRAAVLNDLGRALCDRAAGERSVNLDRALEVFEEAFAGEDRSADPEAWAAALTNLGTVYLEYPLGNPKRDLIRAIDVFRRALTALSPAGAPALWARALINLANAHRERARQDRPRDLEVAIRLYQRAVRGLSPESFPEDWATAQLNLAISWLERLAGDRGANLERGIAACTNGLAVISRQADADLWADLQATLGTLLDHHVRGNRAENQERAIAALGGSLKVHTRSAHPRAWARAVHNLANLYLERVRGDRAGNVEAAIRLYRKELEIWEQEASPIEQAMALSDLAAAFLQRVRGNRRDNVEQSLAIYQRILETVDLTAHPLDRADFVLNLAVAYARREKGDRADNLERAIVLCRQALAVWTRGDMPFDWARAQGNLAYLHTLRLRGNRAENLEEALAASARALEVLNPEDTPEAWADTLNNRGLVFWERVRGGRADNLEESISCFQRALSVRTRKAMPLLWAQTTANLGNALFVRERGERADNLDEAIAAYRRALRALPKRESPLEWAALQHNLATAHLLRLRGDPGENAERALAAARAALRIRTRDATPVIWAETMDTLGLAQAQRLRGNRSANLRRAVAAFRQALEALPADSLPADHRRVQRHLGDVFFGRSRWRPACAAYLAAERVAGQLYASGVTAEGRDYELGENRDLIPRTAYALARTGQMKEAVLLLERWKARALAEALARNEALLGQIPQELEAAFRRGEEQVRGLEREARSAGEPGRRSFAAMHRDLSAALEARDRLIERIREVTPDFLPSGLDFRGLGAMVRSLGHPLVYLIATEQGSLGLLVHGRGPGRRMSIEPLWMEGFQIDSMGLSGPLQAPGAFRRLGQEMAAPLAARLRELGAHAVTLVPVGGLHLLPLQAAPYRLDGRELCLLDELDVAQVPSGRSLAHAMGRLAVLRPSDRLMAVGNPLPVPAGLPALEYAESEARSVAQVAGPLGSLLVGTAVSRRAVEENLWEAGLLHFACHGFFDPEHPLESGLLLAGGECLTVRDLLDGQPLGRVTRTRLAVLSACWSAMTELDRLPDEAIGLPSVFLQAGIPGVVGTLWPVEDLSTALLMRRFYELHLHGDGGGPLPPVHALRRAQLWLRDVRAGELDAFFGEQRRRLEIGEPALDAAAIAAGQSRFALEETESRPFQDPYSWASFVFVGV
jgi:CHAT domain-containing protein/tetratricopeptide (TPR) repeat protein